jgi:CDC-like kinase
LFYQRYQSSDEEIHTQLFDLISRMLEYEPQSRMTLNEALDHPFFSTLPMEHLLHLQDRQQLSTSTAANNDDVSNNDKEERERSHSLSR